MQHSELVPAFADQVTDSQQVFRVLLKALSEPGIRHRIKHTAALEDLCQAGYGIALTLLDSSTSVWLSPRLSSAHIRQNLAFHTGCHFVEEPEKAMFAFLCEEEIAVISRLNPGTDRDPEFSCTAIVQKVSLQSSVEQIWSGPGILNQRKLSFEMPSEFWHMRAQKMRFPQGIDVFFVARDEVLGLPRTTQVQEKSKE